MRQVALLYSVVLTAGRRVKSADLFEVVSDAGAEPRRSVLSTGNIILESDRMPALLEQDLERSLLKLLGKPIPVFVRTAAEWRALVAANPFPEATRRDPSRVAARLMRGDPSPAIRDRIAAAAGPGEAFAATDRALWLTTPDQLSTSALTRAVGANWAGAGTFRNASAVAKIMAALDD
jgi:uncharacterized protein (DUF1697 family)